MKIEKCHVLKGREYVVLEKELSAEEKVKVLEFFYKEFINTAIPLELVSYEMMKVFEDLINGNFPVRFSNLAVWKENFEKSCPEIYNDIKVYINDTAKYKELIYP